MYFRTGKNKWGVWKETIKYELLWVNPSWQVSIMQPLAHSSLTPPVEWKSVKDLFELGFPCQSTNTEQPLPPGTRSTCTLYSLYDNLLASSWDREILGSCPVRPVQNMGPSSSAQKRDEEKLRGKRKEKEEPSERGRGTAGSTGGRPAPWTRAPVSSCPGLTPCPQTPAERYWTTTPHACIKASVSSPFCGKIF